MKTVRLLPVVILAATALLFLKGFGLLTTGGYIFVGPAAVMAASETPAQSPEDHAATPEDGAATLEIPPQPTMEDTNPTIADDTPTFDPATTAPGHETAATAEAAAAPAEGAAAEAAATDTAAAEAPPAVPDLACADGTIPAPADAATPAAGDCVPAADPRAEGVPMVQNAAGQPVPLAAADGTSLTEDTVLERLSSRRSELDAREQELDMRVKLIEAAEARLDERSAALSALEAQVNALVEAQKTAADTQFASIVKMYEQMKPTDAATIFNDLDMQVLLRVSQGMNPRKMAPILAKMIPSRAQALTLAMAAGDAPLVAPAAAEPAGQDLAALPQIVGQ